MSKSFFSLLVVFALAVTPVFAEIVDEDPLGNTACADLTTSLRYGMKDTGSNNDIAILQDFLAGSNYLSSQPTGFFGRMTLNAVKAFQSANGISATGFVGPATRAKIKDIDCNGGSTTTTTTFTYTSDIAGVSPLYVQFKASENTVCDGQSKYSIEFGDGNRGSLSANWLSSTNSSQYGSTGGNMFCDGYLGTHTYAQAGTYMAKLFKTTPYSCPSIPGVSCTTVMPAPVQVGTLTVTVGGQTSTMCTSDAKVCPDGSYVGRAGPSCEFSACPTTTTMCTRDMKMCPDGSSIGRTGPNCEFNACPVTTVVVPAITSLSPTSGKVGTQIIINGTGFTSDSSILFDGYSFGFDAVSADIRFTVPTYYPSPCSGATGFYCTASMRLVSPGTHTVAVKNANGTSNSVKFTVTTDINTAMCDYAAPPEGCTYVQGPNYDPTTGCGMTLACTSMEKPATVLGATTACVDLPYNLYRGFESPSVSTLQSFLSRKGFLNENSTGFYGDATVAAVNKYQQSKGLPMTGMVYDFTRAAIKTETCQ